jgi:hypothetical protein
VNGLHPGGVVVEEIEHLSHLSLKLTPFRKMAESLILCGQRVAKNGEGPPQKVQGPP